MGLVRPSRSSSGVDTFVVSRCHVAAAAGPQETAHHHHHHNLAFSTIDGSPACTIPCIEELVGTPYCSCSRTPSPVLTPGWKELTRSFSWPDVVEGDETIGSVCLGPLFTLYFCYSYVPSLVRLSVPVQVIDYRLVSEMTCTMLMGMLHVILTHSLKHSNHPSVVIYKL